MLTKILGGYQTDFARNWLKEGISIVDAFKECVNGALESSHLNASDIQTIHVGNAAAAVENGDLSPDDALQLLNIEVVGPNGKKGRYEDVYEGRANGLHEAIFKRRQTELRRQNYTLQAFNQKSNLQILKAKEKVQKDLILSVAKENKFVTTCSAGNLSLIHI